MNWKELKDFCSSLPEEKLSNTVVLWRESEGIGKIDPIILNEDHYIDPKDSENGCFGKSEAIGGLKGLKKVYNQGDPILMENF